MLQEFETQSLQDGFESAGDVGARCSALQFSTGLGPSGCTGYIGYPFEKTAVEERESRCQTGSL